MVLEGGLWYLESVSKNNVAMFTIVKKKIHKTHTKYLLQMQISLLYSWFKLRHFQLLRSYRINTQDC